MPIPPSVSPFLSVTIPQCHQVSGVPSLSQSTAMMQLLDFSSDVNSLGVAVCAAWSSEVTVVFFQTICQKTPKDSAKYENCKQALKEVSKVCSQVLLVLPGKNGCFACMKNAGRSSTEVQSSALLYLRKGTGDWVCAELLVPAWEKIPNWMIPWWFWVCVCEMNPAGRRGCVWS